MHDGVLVLLWSAIFAGGIGFCLLLARMGAPRSSVRDVLHIGAGMWPLGWWGWHSPWPPVLVALAGFLALVSIPLLGRRWSGPRSVERAVSDEEEVWLGLELYALSAVVFTALGLFRRAPVPAAAALMALALGDGMGGLVGRSLGLHRYRAPWGKSKSLEGSAAVAVFSGLGAALPGVLFAAPLSGIRVIGAGIAGAAVEALAPRATDNVLVPLVVWLVAGGLESSGPP